MTDIDRFKEVSDGLGHLCGDAAIRAVSRVLISRTEGLGEVVRYGGDEFLVSFLAIAEEELRATLEDIRASVRAIRLEDYPDVRLSMNIGVAYGEGQGARMVAIADEALYASKARRDTVTILPYEQDMLLATIPSDTLDLMS